MPQYLENSEEKHIHKIIEELAAKLGLCCPKKEVQFRDMGYYLDRIWYMELEGEDVPIAAFEIEKGVPGNERTRKDILNIVLSKAPKGYLITPHKRILMKATGGSGWETWYRDHFLETFKKYHSPFIFYCDVQLVDADMLISSNSLKESIVRTPY